MAYVVVALVGGALFVVGVVSVWIGFNEMNPSTGSMGAAGPWFAGGVISGLAGSGVLIVGLFSVVLAQQSGAVAVQRAIRASGRDAVATVLAVRATRHPDAIRPTVVLRLRVWPRDGSPPYDGECREVMPSSRIPSVGDHIPVRYDQRRPWQIATMR
jgi:hypothetical protein